MDRLSQDPADRRSRQDARVGRRHLGAHDSLGRLLAEVPGGKVIEVGEQGPVSQSHQEQAGSRDPWSARQQQDRQCRAQDRLADADDPPAVQPGGQQSGEEPPQGHARVVEHHQSGGLLRRHMPDLHQKGAGPVPAGALDGTGGDEQRPHQLYAGNPGNFSQAQVLCLLLRSGLRCRMNLSPHRQGNSQQRRHSQLDAEGNPVGRFAGYHIGAVAADGTKIAPRYFSYNWLNMAFTAAATYKMTKQFGFTADFTYNTQRPNMSNFAPAEMPNVDKITIPLGRAGIYFNNDWISLTSLFSYIAKTNNNSTLNLINPNNDKDIKAAALSYDIETIGWTTDAVVKPFKGFDFHFLFTYQSPKYKKYETGVTFSDGTTSGINATGNIVTEIPKVLIELDPSYNITKDLKVWASFRYFSKTYANIKNAYYFNGRWETFGGINWNVNKHLSLSGTVINFLNQTGAKGSISGAELVDKENAAAYNGAWMAGSYIRPFTVEFAAKITF